MQVPTVYAPQVLLSCLQVWEQTPGLYVPQVGDRVVYLQQGHKLYYDRLQDKRRGPWDTIISTAVRPEHYVLTSTMKHRSMYMLSRP